MFHLITYTLFDNENRSGVGFVIRIHAYSVCPREFWEQKLLIAPDVVNPHCHIILGSSHVLAVVEAFLLRKAQMILKRSGCIPDHPTISRGPGHAMQFFGKTWLSHYIAKHFPTKTNFCVLIANLIAKTSYNPRCAMYIFSVTWYCHY